MVIYHCADAAYTFICTYYTVVCIRYTPIMSVLLASVLDVVDW